MSLCEYNAWLDNILGVRCVLPAILSLLFGSAWHCVKRYLAAAGTAQLLSGYNPATWMLEVTGGAMATLTPANANVDWPATYLASQLCQANATKAEALIEQVSCSTPGTSKLAIVASGGYSPC
jgi:hypothetical protein